MAKRETILAAVDVKAAGPAADALQKIELKLKPEDPDGVLIATVWGPDGLPLAERLVFRQPRKTVSVKITADAPQYVPGGKARVTLQTTDEDGKPVDAVVGVTVTDDSVLEMIERREQAPRLPVMVLLESEVRELADAHVYLDPANEQAPLAVDLLLGTQGWRRFAFVRTEEFLREHGDAGRRAAGPADRHDAGNDAVRRRVRRGLADAGWQTGMPMAMPAGAAMPPGLAMPGAAGVADACRSRAPRLRRPHRCRRLPNRCRQGSADPRRRTSRRGQGSRPAEPAPAVASQPVREEQLGKRQRMAEALEQG